MITQGEISPFRYGEISITVRGGGSSSDKEVKVIIDTGFDGGLSLPASIVAELDLPRSGRTLTTVFGGAEAEFDVHDAIVLLAGEERGIPVLVAENPPLIGMMLLHGLELYMNIVDGGLVTLTRQPNEPIEEME